MGDYEAQIAILEEKTASTRYEFLKAEIHACAIALEMARFEYEKRNRAYGDREADVAARAIGTIERFLPQVRDLQQVELREKAAWLKSALNCLKQEYQGKAA